MANVHGLRDLNQRSNNSQQGGNPFAFGPQPGHQASQEEELISAPLSKLYCEEKEKININQFFKMNL